MNESEYKGQIKKRKSVGQREDKFETRFDHLPGLFDLADAPIINVDGMVCMEPSSHNHEDPEIPIAVYAGADIH